MPHVIRIWIFLEESKLYFLAAGNFCQEEDLPEACGVCSQDIQQKRSHPAGTEEHQASPTQWFSPLGSSVNRFMSDSPSPSSTDSLVSEVSSRPEEPGLASQQLRPPSPRASGALGVPFGRQSSGDACGAVQERQRQQVMTADVGAQHDAVGDLLGLHISPPSTWPVNKCSTLQHVQGPDSLQPMGWEQRSSATAESYAPACQQRQQQTSRMHVSKPAAAWEAQWPHAAHDFWHTPEAGHAPPSVQVAAGCAIDLCSQAQGLGRLLASDHAIDRKIEHKVSDKDAELATLRQQVWLHSIYRGLYNSFAETDNVDGVGLHGCSWRRRRAADWICNTSCMLAELQRSALLQMFARYKANSSTSPLGCLVPLLVRLR